MSAVSAEVSGRQGVAGRLVRAWFSRDHQPLEGREGSSPSLFASPARVPQVSITKPTGCVVAAASLKRPGTDPWSNYVVRRIASYAPPQAHGPPELATRGGQNIRKSAARLPGTHTDCFRNHRNRLLRLASCCPRTLRSARAQLATEITGRPRSSDARGPPPRKAGRSTAPGEALDLSRPRPTR